VRMRERLIANLPRYAPWAARLAPLLNLRDRIPGLAALSERLLGLSARRPLPRWRRDVFSAPRPPAGNGNGSGPEVVLLVDTFNTYFEPENARAAVAVLEAAGRRVHVAGGGGRPLCCGRTFLSAGLVEEARREAGRMIEALRPYVERGLPVIGLEPSCLFTLRDEFKALVGGRDADALDGRAHMFEEYLAAESAAGRLALSLRPLPWRRALVHGHCHQKAFAATGAVGRTLGLIPDLQVEALQSGCCGMAGAFGYEAEHFEVSMKMAELDLLPAVRAAGEDTVVVADGTSCRHQVRDGTGREALHTARVLEAALAG